MRNFNILSFIITYYTNFIIPWIGSTSACLDSISSACQHSFSSTVYNSDQVRSLVNAVIKPSASRIYGEFLDDLSHYHLLKYNSVAWS
jgi:hypothetical protein